MHVGGLDEAYGNVVHVGVRMKHTVMLCMGGVRMKHTVMLCMWGSG